MKKPTWIDWTVTGGFVAVFYIELGVIWFFDIANITFGESIIFKINNPITLAALICFWWFVKIIAKENVHVKRVTVAITECVNKVFRG
jgi:hypothetical protein